MFHFIIEHVNVNFRGIFRTVDDLKLVLVLKEPIYVLILCFHIHVISPIMLYFIIYEQLC